MPEIWKRRTTFSFGVTSNFYSGHDTCLHYGHDDNFHFWREEQLSFVMRFANDLVLLPFSLGVRVFFVYVRRGRVDLLTLVVVIDQGLRQYGVFRTLCWSVWITEF